MLGVRLPASSALCCRACSRSRTCCSREEGLWLLAGGGASLSSPAPGARQAGREEVLTNFPVRAPPCRMVWMACRSASCCADSF